MDENRVTKLIEELNKTLGNDISNLQPLYDCKLELVDKKNELLKSLSSVNSEVPTKISEAIKTSEETTLNILEYKEKLIVCSEKNQEFLTSVEPVRNHLGVLVDKLRKLEATKEYLESLRTVKKISNDLSNCNDSEQSVLLMEQLYELHKQYKNGHRGEFVTETTHYWYNALRDKLSIEFEDVLKQVKWPITSSNISLTVSVPQEAFNKFRQIVQYLLQIQMPVEDNKRNDEEHNLSLPIRLMIVPLKKRFTFHFSGSRRTNRLDRPEWFLTQILSWLRDHLPFLAKYLQPIVDSMDMKINVQQEFTCGLMQLAVDRLYSLLSTISGDDSLFSHAIDECLGFDRELESIIGFPLLPTCPRVTTVLTDARYLIRWLAVEKKFAIQKIDEMLRSDEWLSTLGSKDIELGEEPEGIPQGADWLVSLLQTLHDRYSSLPQPGHRLQFLDLQTELCEEVRLRLTQLIEEEIRLWSSKNESRGVEGVSRLLSMLNVVHYFRQALLDWTHAVSYLQLYYYKKQFQCFTEMQHMPIPDLDTTPTLNSHSILSPQVSSDEASNLTRRGSLSLSQVEADAKELALQEANNIHSELINDNENITTILNHEESEPDIGVFEELPRLLGRIVDDVCLLLCDDLVLEIKAASRDYRNQKWHYLPEVEDIQCRSLTSALCAPLGALSTRLLVLRSSLAPELFGPLWRAVAKEIDIFIFEEVVLECWWGPGGIQQFHFDMIRNLMPIFAQYTSSAEAYLPKIAESCKLLTMLRGTALLLRETINGLHSNGSLSSNTKPFAELSILHLTENEIIRVLNQRTDMNMN
ncbi:RAD50 interactor 1 [Arctopsyche grandis]|uniref:RAD50 interactor 1 n=1 Tax=Arctopsyche grandis TaxID=121162 RepID=UPI00406D8BB0